MGEDSTICQELLKQRDNINPLQLRRSIYRDLDHLFAYPLAVPGHVESTFETLADPDRFPAAVAALKAVEALGYPAILKPIHGSWGRLVALLNDPSSAKAIIESRAYLHPIHKVFYIQEFVKRPPRDIRSFVVGDRVVTAIYRVAPRGEWRTNVMRGGRVEVCPITEELEELSLKAAEAVGGGVLGVDIMEGSNGLIVHEVNHVPGFANAAKVSKESLPGLIVEYAVELAKR